MALIPALGELEVEGSKVEGQHGLQEIISKKKERERAGKEN